MSDDDKKNETVRVAMMFPVDLKAELQELTGPRGMTAWVIDAIQERMGSQSGETRVLGPTSELNEARKLAQSLADELANVDTNPNPPRFLQEMPLPEWLSQKEWPSYLQTEKPEAPVEVEPKLVPEKAAVDLKEIAEQVEPPVSVPAWADEPIGSEKKPVEDAPPTALTPPVAGKSDLLARTQAKMAELGIDSTGFKPASMVQSPPEKPHVDPEAQKAIDERVHEVLEEKRQDTEFTERVEARVEADAPILNRLASDPVSENRCPTCGAEMIDGECWTCMF